MFDELKSLLSATQDAQSVDTFCRPACSFLAINIAFGPFHNTNSKSVQAQLATSMHFLSMYSRRPGLSAVFACSCLISFSLSAPGIIRPNHSLKPPRTRFGYLYVFLYTLHLSSLTMGRPRRDGLHLEAPPPCAIQELMESTATPGDTVVTNRHYAYRSILYADFV